MTDPIHFRGVVHGKIIEFENEIGLPDGQPVTVSVRPIDQTSHGLCDGIRHSAGAWADDVEGLSTYLDASRKLRQIDRPGIEP